MYRYALRPRWILSHLFALFVVVSFVNLGLWQLRRHDERAARNALVEARAALAPVDVADLGLDGGVDPDSLRFRAVRADGAYEDRDILVDNRSEGGLPGVWVLTPMRRPDGSIVVVNRGFQGYRAGELADRARPAGTVVVHGTAVPWASSCGTRHDDTGALVGMACLNRVAVEEALGASVASVVIQRVRSEPAEDADVRPVPPPELTAGPHRSYAAQWFIFTTIVAVVYVLILRRVARDRAREPAA